MAPPSDPGSRAQETLPLQLPQLTFLRFLAAVAVVIYHFGKDAPSLAWGAGVWKHGGLAVPFFFVLSGFILTHVYGLRGLGSRTQFYRARFARIYPVYALALLLVWALQVLGIREDDPVLDDLLAATLLQSWVPGHSQAVNAPGWSLSVEMLFYLLFPLLLGGLLRLRGRRALLWILLGLWLLSQAGFLWAVSQFVASESDAVRDALFFHPLVHVPTFVCGALGGLLFHAHYAWLQRHGKWLIGLGLLGPVFIHFGARALLEVSGAGMLNLFSLCVILGLAADRSVLSRVLSWSPLLLLGEASYAVYILQAPIGMVFTHRALESGQVLGSDPFIWSILVSLLLLSVLVYQFYERPLRRWLLRP